MHFLVSIIAKILCVSVLKDGARLHVLEQTDEFTRERLSSGCTRDCSGEPMGALVFRLRARVTALLTNHCRGYEHVDVIQYDKEQGGSVPVVFREGLCP